MTAAACIVPNCPHLRCGYGPFGGSLCAEHAQGIESPAKRKSKPVDYLTVEQRFRLNEACRAFNEAFPDGGFGVYLVGSVMERPDFRDVDVRAIVRDEFFARLYPNADPKAPARDTYWHLSMVSFSVYLRGLTGLPIDFQVQQQTAANEEFPGERNALGIGLARRKAPSFPELVWTSNGEAGDGQSHCSGCGEERDECHTWEQCTAVLRKQRDALIDAAPDSGRVEP